MRGSKFSNGIFGFIASAMTVLALATVPQTGVAAARIKTSPLKISGTAPTSVPAGSLYSFAPSTNGGGSTKTFAIRNKPVWASFSISSGTLSGTPNSTQVGIYSNVTIAVTDGKSTATLSPFGVAVTAPQSAPTSTSTTTTSTTTGSAALTWTAPTQNTDGSALVDLAGYAIYFGTSATSLGNRIVVSSAAATNYTVANLAKGTYYFALAAYTSTGIESALSSIGSKTIL